MYGGSVCVCVRGTCARTHPAAHPGYIHAYGHKQQRATRVSPTQAHLLALRRHPALPSSLPTPKCHRGRWQQPHPSPLAILAPPTPPPRPRYCFSGVLLTMGP